MNEGDTVPYTGVLVPVPVWDHYQTLDIKNKVYEERFGELGVEKVTSDHTAIFFLVGVAIGAVGMSLTNEQNQTAIAFVGGTAIGFGIHFLLK